LTGRTPLLAPSVLAADFGRLAEEIASVVAGGADWIHVDVMDGHFVPNLTFGAEMVRTVRRVTELPIDVHLMIEHPERVFDEYVEAGAGILTFHVEATRHLHRHLQRIRELGAKAGAAINPGTPLDAVNAAWEEMDILLVMSVNPGWAGQAFVRSSLDKLRAARERIDALPGGMRPLLEVDGGIDVANVAEVTAAGADVLVSGSGIYGGDDPAESTRALRAAAGKRRPR
jgi:ribulose-phosphate 3-epimerase